jgi:hypothetical protein
MHMNYILYIDNQSYNSISLEFLPFKERERNPTKKNLSKILTHSTRFSFLRKFFRDIHFHGQLTSNQCT